MTVWILLMLSIFSLSVSHRASQELIFGRWVRDQVTTRVLAKAGIERALLELQLDKFLTFDAFNESWGSNEEAFKEIRLQQGTFTVSCDQPLIEAEEDTEKKEIKTEDPETEDSKASELKAVELEKAETKRYGLCDEAARININFADEEILTNLLLASVKKIVALDATKIAQSIIDWRDADDAAQQAGAESSFYGFLPTPYKARNASFESVEELLMIRGVTREIYNQIKNDVTVYTDGKVNFNTASQTALQALGLSPDLAKRLVEFRKGTDGILGNEDDPAFQMVEGITPALSAGSAFSGEDFAQITHAVGKQMVGVKSQVFRIQSIGRLNRSGQDIQTRVTCVTKRNGMVLYWHEGYE